jgi:hypothetical protein
MNFFKKIGRISGASPRKPGFPLQVLGFANANPAGFPLQSLARAQRQRKIASRFCHQPGRMGGQPPCAAAAQKKAPELPHGNSGHIMFRLFRRFGG